jgi:hypothetical protein
MRLASVVQGYKRQPPGSKNDVKPVAVCYIGPAGLLLGKLLKFCVECRGDLGGVELAGAFISSQIISMRISF